MRTQFFILINFAALLYTPLTVSQEYWVDSTHREGYKAIGEAYGAFVKRVCQKYDVEERGEDISFPLKIETMGGYFKAKKALNLDEIRLLELQLIKDYQEIINQNLQLRKFLSKYPFPADKIDITLSLSEGRGKSVSDAIEYAYSSGGKVIYCLRETAAASVLDRKKIEEKLEDACAKTGMEIPYLH